MRVLFITLILLASTAHAAVLELKVVDQSGQPLADAVAYLMPAHATPTRAPNDAAIAQLNKNFIPLVTAVQTGASIEFPNRDDVRHHVYSFSPAKPFELRLYVGTPREPVNFDKPGVVVLGCNIHDNMLAYVVVVDTPFFGKSDEQGNIKMNALPDGAYALHIWHPRLADASVLPGVHSELRLPRGPLNARLNIGDKAPPAQGGAK